MVNGRLREKPRTTTYFECEKCHHIASWDNMRKLLNRHRWNSTVLACPKCGCIDTKVVKDGPKLSVL